MESGMQNHIFVNYFHLQALHMPCIWLTSWRSIENRIKRCSLLALKRHFTWYQVFDSSKLLLALRPYSISDWLGLHPQIARTTPTLQCLCHSYDTYREEDFNLCLFTIIMRILHLKSKPIMLFPIIARYSRHTGYDVFSHSSTWPVVNHIVTNLE